MNIERILTAESAFLDELFGTNQYVIEKVNDQTIKVNTNWLELQLGYDFRDGFVSSYITPKNVEPSLAEEHLGDTFLQYLEIDPETPSRGPLDRERIRDALTDMRPVIEALKDSDRSRNACFFALGYSAAYNDWASGKI